MVPRLNEMSSLWDYTEPINSRIFRKARNLSEDSQKTLAQLREKYASLGFLLLHYTVDDQSRKQLDLPLRRVIRSRTSSSPSNLPDKLLDASSLRDFVEAICTDSAEAIKASTNCLGVGPEGFPLKSSQSYLVSLLRLASISSYR